MRCPHRGLETLPRAHAPGYPPGDAAAAVHRAEASFRAAGGVADHQPGDRVRAPRGAAGAGARARRLHRRRCPHGHAAGEGYHTEPQDNETKLSIV